MDRGTPAEGRGDAELKQVRTLLALHRREGLLELTSHRLLDDSGRRQEFAYADGTRVGIDLDTDAWTVTPEVTTGELAGGATELARAR